jgi:recombination associated protein RdgC
MWFKNLTCFRFLEPVAWSAEAFADTLNQAAFVPCMSRAMTSAGWVPPLGASATDLVHAVNGCWLFCLQKEEKILPATVISEAVAQRVAEIAAQELRTVRRNEKVTIREAIIQELLPRAFTHCRRHYAYIDVNGRWLIVDSAARKSVEQLTGLLRHSLGSLPIVPLRVANSPSIVMTHWLASDQLANDFSLSDECELRDQGEAGAVVRCQGQDLRGEEIRAHLQAGKQATRLGLSWNGYLSFLLTEELGLRRLRFLDVVIEQLPDTETAEQVFDAQFVLMTGVLREFLPRLLTVFGGEAQR